ncbi:MAG: signal peptidase II [Clostridia bacterium]|nr:signal peptidase II [Clostridia bacterium]
MFIWICVMVAAVFVDQITKWLAVIFLQGGEVIRWPVVDLFIQFRYIENRGAAWGMFSDQRWVFMTFSTVAIVGVLIFMFVKKPKSRLLNASLSLIVAGGIGNMIDRVFAGYVVDFLDFTFMDFPVFNGADCFVCIGAGMLILYLVLDTVREMRADKLKKEQAEAEKKEAEEKGDGDGEQ